MVCEWRDLPSNWRDIPPGSPGVYFFLSGETPVYIGKSKSLKGRIQNHHLIRSELKSGQWSVRFLVCDQADMGAVERACIRHYQPAANTQYRKPKAIKIQRNIPSSGFPPAPRRFPKDRRSMMAQVASAWRKSTERTHGDMAALIGVRLNDYARFENGSEPSVETRQKVVNWLLE